MIRRLIDVAEKTEDAGADGILFTCSSLSIRHLFSVPVLSADESMLVEAVEIGEQIGVIATVKKAGSTTSLLYEFARE